VVWTYSETERKVKGKHPRGGLRLRWEQS
jgi:hypothetical protein